MGRRDEYERFDREIEAMGVRVKDADQVKVRDDVFDEVTLVALYRLVHRKLISVIGGPISTGKEANIYYGEHDGRGIAIKIYRIQTANFKAMTEYLAGDRRFASVRGSRKGIIFAWTKKEYSNLARAHDAGIPVPKPLAFDRNILLMEFLGEGEAPYPQLRLAEVEDYGAVYQEVLDYVQRLYRDARLVHADLSEYNILYHEKPYLIDMGQAVTLDHPQALTFLIRDIKNLNRYFSRYCDVLDEQEIVRTITGTGRREP
ncbi:serine protein kinase RIO [Methanoculleus bourgensis]|mgnify:CR=1 FL=1|uniref:non-specific serine/threonine protein kinase n=2 Tax=Methanoculleus bourgensis TaxID=83986 RepID=A0A0X8Y0E1_9EURY|nr:MULTISPECIES: serine protein kinase RIO [Methanoculleus]MBT0732614.1 serine protein kinase RIO [Methanoculleus bourgensis]MDD3373073.1 serine protein kinase RIO [Methanoculleus bourgensis]NMA89252.1 serine protein kinase RIO [Methanoculleus bourgensis]CVK34720.1 RIO-type serine/threonine-protein kinase Rio1 [Methanoculleus bourgensis]SAI89411.1 RIO kinase 1 [Methanoculleus bourgensis]